MDNLRTIKRRQSAASLQALRRMVDSSSHVWTPYCSTVTIQECVTCSHRLIQSIGCFNLPLNQKTHAVKHTSSTSDTTEKHLVGHTDAIHTYLETDTISTENSKADNTTPLDTLHNTVSVDTSIHTQHARISNSGNTISLDCSHENPSMDITNTDLSIPNIDSDINMTENMAEPSVSREPHFITPLVPMASSTPRTIKAPQTTDSSTSPMIKHITTFNHSLSLPVDEPLSKDEETLNTHLVKRKLYADPHKKTIKCKTKGRPILLQKVVAPRKHTSQVKTPTQKKRARIIENIRTSVAGTSKDAEDIQLAVELNRLPTIRRHGIYKRAGLKKKIKLTGEQTLAMKEELGPQGTFPCLWCLMSRQEMHLHSTNTQLRSLDSLISDNLSFMQDNADKKSAPKYNISFHAPILSIQLDRVSLSYLHILLGNVLKYHKLLENAAHLLDTKITTLGDSHLTDLGKLVKQYGGQRQQAQSLQEQLDFQ
ncbi:nrag8 protein [Plakobranchus ocellatus]|uniref:Nrag8 protein n=1 Tax=Plakobranchus ocellatus TaxID=259542 RepID=A0AAV4AN74_9GAST|nr:nrag8 protein [Plakobranchus ocellatus]